ncbi:hypothetical protein DFJ74DRAFT_679618 [Hyaloraphidium curvatum]|nr:hypothetical protein DFJ74DRAFT_679618 [Hyaloraphidium curvatum]
MSDEFKAPARQVVDDTDEFMKEFAKTVAGKPAAKPAPDAGALPPGVGQPRQVVDDTEQFMKDFARTAGGRPAAPAAAPAEPLPAGVGQPRQVKDDTEEFLREIGRFTGSKPVSAAAAPAQTPEEQEAFLRQLAKETGVRVSLPTAGAEVPKAAEPAKHGALDGLLGKFKHSGPVTDASELGLSGAKAAQAAPIGAEAGHAAAPATQAKAPAAKEHKGLFGGMFSGSSHVADDPAKLLAEARRGGAS